METMKGLTRDGVLAAIGNYQVPVSVSTTKKEKRQAVPPSSWVTVRSLMGVAKIIESFQSQVPSKKLSNGVRHSSSYSSHIECHSSEPFSLHPDHFMPYRCDWDRSHTRWSTETTIRDTPVSYFR